MALDHQRIDQLVRYLAGPYRLVELANGDRMVVDAEGGWQPVAVLVPWDCYCRGAVSGPVPIPAVMPRSAPSPGPDPAPDDPPPVTPAPARGGEAVAGLDAGAGADSNGRHGPGRVPGDTKLDDPTVERLRAIWSAHPNKSSHWVASEFERLHARSIAHGTARRYKPAHLPAVPTENESYRRLTEEQRAILADCWETAPPDAGPAEVGRRFAARVGFSVTPPTVVKYRPVPASPARPVAPPAGRPPPAPEGRGDGPGPADPTPDDIRTETERIKAERLRMLKEGYKARESSHYADKKG